MCRGLLLTYKLSQAALVCRYGVIGSGDGTTYDDKVRANLASLGRGCYTYLVAYLSIGKANTRRNSQKFIATGVVYFSCLQR